MRELLRSCAIAFSTYSRIPMPMVEWNEKNMRHTLAFFPLVGAAVGAVFWGAGALCGLLDAGPILRAGVLTAVPALVTGGIHLDGYCDTVDALASHASRERKLVILKDSSAGAFAVIWCCVWFLAYFSLLTEAKSLPTLAAGFVLSRALSARAIERLPSARAGMGAGSPGGCWRSTWYCAAGRYGSGGSRWRRWRRWRRRRSSTSTTSQWPCASSAASPAIWRDGFCRSVSW